MTTPGNAKHQAAAARSADLVDQLRNEILEQLIELIRLEHKLRDLADTSQSVGLGFLTPDARAAADKQARDDRDAVRGITGRIDTMGLRWLNANSIDSTGATEAPVTMPAVATSAEILFTLQDYLRRLARQAFPVAQQADRIAHLRRVELERLEDRAGVCLWPQPLAIAATRAARRHPLTVLPPNSDGDVVDVARHLARVVEYSDRRRVLQDLLRDLEHLIGKAQNVLEGPAKTNHPHPCPWCGRTTLVIHHREPGRDSGVIRCEGTHDCVCDWEWCPCHRNPRTHRHEWINSGRAAHTWAELNNLQTTRKELLAMETKALDALERIRQLHQPTWHGDDGQTAPAYVYLAGDGIPVPADHECVDDWVSEDGSTVVHGCIEADQDLVLHAVPVCTTCGTAGQTGDLEEAVLWPCPTHQACDTTQPDTSTTEE